MKIASDLMVVIKTNWNCLKFGCWSFQTRASRLIVSTHWTKCEIMVLFSGRKATCGQPTPPPDWRRPRQRPDFYPSRNFPNSDWYLEKEKHFYAVGWDFYSITRFSCGRFFNWIVAQALKKCPKQLQWCLALALRSSSHPIMLQFVRSLKIQCIVLKILLLLLLENYSRLFPEIILHHPGQHYLLED